MRAKVIMPGGHQCCQIGPDFPYNLATLYADTPLVAAPPNRDERRVKDRAEQKGLEGGYYSSFLFSSTTVFLAPPVSLVCRRRHFVVQGLDNTRKHTSEDL